MKRKTNIYEMMYGSLNEMARGVHVGYRDEGFQVTPGENYYIFAGGTKPFHAGHDQMIMHAINDAAQDPNSKVILFIGLGDRGALKGEAMQQVWTAYIEDHYESISPNIRIEYGGGPVGKVLALLKEANALAQTGVRPDNMFYVYADPEDTQGYYLLPKFSKKDPSVELKSSPPKYSDALRSMDPPGVSFMGADFPDRFTRGGEGGTLDISGTKMREYLETGDIDSFKSGLPDWMDTNTKHAVFQILTTPALNEIKRADKGSSDYSRYLQEMIEELQYIKGSYNSRKKEGKQYRKEASLIQNTISELKRQKRKNDRLNEIEKENTLNEGKGIDNRDILKEWFKSSYKRIK
jgi:hypothetical protein